jgi:hypothetical protein
VISSDVSPKRQFCDIGLPPRALHTHGLVIFPSQTYPIATV